MPAAGVAWLIVAYLLNRRGYHVLAGALIVALALTALAGAIYVLPGALTVLLPFVGAPTALAALLLSRRAIYVTVTLTICAVAGAVAASWFFPAPLVFVFPPSSDVLLLSMASLSAVMFALALAPLRGHVTALRDRLALAEAAALELAALRDHAEQTCADAQRQLAAQQRYTDMILRHMSDGVVTVDQNDVIIRANAVAQTLWATVDSAPLVGDVITRVRTLLDAQDQATAQAEIEPVSNESASSEDGVTYMLRDRREHARLARLRGALLRLLTDEMRAPLTSVITALEMTLGQNLPEGADRVLLGARRNGQRLLDLVTLILEITQIEQRPDILRRSARPLRPIIEAGIAQTTPLQHQGAVTVIVEYNGDGVFWFDAERMQRAFVHLLERALRNSPPYSTVQVRTERQNGSVMVRISDQGPGLTEQQRDLLFDQQSLTDDRGASALALAFSKLVIEVHGGRVWVESSGSQGCAYMFLLPLQTEQ